MQLFELKDGDGRDGAGYDRVMNPAARALASRPLPQGGRPAGATLHADRKENLPTRDAHSLAHSDTQAARL
jgi:hypothetical protein